MAIDLFFEPEVTLNAPDNRLKRAGYMKRWYPHDPELLSESDSTMWVWPKINLITQEPVYADSPDSSLASWEVGNGTYAECAGLWGSSGQTIVQSDPTAVDCTLTAKAFTNAANQAFFIDLYLHQSFLKTWWADFKFSEKHALRFLYNGVIQLWRNFAHEGQEDKWSCVDSGETVSNVFNQHLRLAVYITADQQIIVYLLGYNPIIWRDPDPVKVEIPVGDPEYPEDPNLPPTPAPVVEQIQTTQEYQPTLYVSNGAFYFGYRRMEFDPNGKIKLPEHSLPWESNQDVFQFIANTKYPRVPETEGTLTVELRDEADEPLVSGASSFQDFSPYFEIANGDSKVSVELNWLQLYLEPQIQEFVPAPIVIPAGGILLNATTDASAGSDVTAEIVIFNKDGVGEPYRQGHNVCTQISVAGTPVWFGYLDEVQDKEDASGEITFVRHGTDALKRLDVPLSDAYIGDDVVHTDYVAELMKYCGLRAPIPAIPPSEDNPEGTPEVPGDFIIDTDPNNLKLPAAPGVDKPLFQITDGRTARCMIDYIREVFSGWDLRMELDGRIHYALPKTSYAAITELTGSGIVLPAPRTITPEDPEEEPTTVPGKWKYFSLRKITSEKDFFNYIVVIGMDYTGTPIIAAYYNQASIDDPANANHIGQEKLLLVVDTNLKTEVLTEKALDITVKWQGEILGQVEIDASFGFLDADGGMHYPDLDEAFTIEDGDEHLWRLVGIERQFEPPMVKASLQELPSESQPG